MPRLPAPGIHPGDVIDDLQFFAHSLGIFIEIGVGIAVGANTNQETEYKAKIVAHLWFVRTRR